MGKSIKSLLVLLVLGLLCSVETQVLGIDFGTEFWKAALISPGKNLVIVENSRSERKTLNSIAFQDGVRFFEDDSLSKRLKKPEISYFYLNQLIRSLDTKKPVEGYEFNGQTYILENAGKQMTLEQVVAMILKNIKNLASLQAGTDIRDVVLSVPANWQFQSRMSLVNAAHLADFSVLGIINENSAAAIQFAISRNDTDPVHAVLFNYGSHNLQISVLKAFGLFDQTKNKTIQSVQMLSHVTVEDVGGLKVDQAIADYLASQFMKKHKVDPKKNRKSYTKLLIKASDVKETLSANKDVQVYVEGLIDGIDLNLPVSRQVLEDCAHFSDFAKYLNEAFSKANIKKSDVQSLQLIGGASRIPKVWQVVKDYFSDAETVQIGTNMNGDESVAFGSALRAANLSLTFRVKQLHFYDPMNIDTKVVISSPDQGVIVEQKLFELTDHHGARKSITIPQNTQDIKITIYAGEEIVRQFSTKGVSDWKQKHKNDNLTAQPTLNIEFAMSSVHIVDVKDVYLNVTLNVTSVREKVEYVDEEVIEEVPIKKNETAKEGVETGSAEEKPDQVPETQQQQASTEDGEKEADKKQENKQERPNQESQKGPEEQGTKQKKTRKRKVTKTKTIKKTVEQHEIRNKRHLPAIQQTFSRYKKFPKEQIDQKKKLLLNFETFEKELKQKAKIRNDFESALYSLKDSFEEQYLKTFSTQDELSNLIDTVTKQLQWLDENAWTANKAQFQEHFKTLSDAYDPIFNRTTQYRNRQKGYNETLEFLGTVYHKTSELLTTHAWIKQKVEAHLKKINETAEWVVSKIQEQAKRPLNANPVIYNYQMYQKAEDLRKDYYILKMIPRPKIDIDQIMKKFEEEERRKKKQEEQKAQADAQGTPGQNQQQQQQQTETAQEPEDNQQQTEEDL